MKWRKAVIGDRIDIGSVFQQPLQDFLMAKSRGDMQRSAFVFIDSVDQFRICL